MEELKNLIREYDSNLEEEVYLKLVDKVKSMEDLIFVRSVNTKLYYLEDYLDRPCTKMFVSREDFEKFRQEMIQEKIKVSGMATKVGKRDFLAGDLSRCGIKLIQLMVDGLEVIMTVEELFGTATELRLDNHELLLLANTFIEKARRGQANPQDEEVYLKKFSESKFIVPVKGKKGPADEEGKAQFEIPIFTNKEGTKAQFLFSDLYEFSAFNQKKEYTSLTVNYQDLRSLYQGVDSLIFNPMSINMVITETVFDRIEKVIRFSKMN